MLPVLMYKLCTASRFCVFCAVRSARMSFAPSSASSTVGTLNSGDSAFSFTNSFAFSSIAASSSSSIASASGSSPFSIATMPRVFFFFLNGAHKSSRPVSVEADIAAVYKDSVNFPCAKMPFIISKRRSSRFRYDLKR